MARVPWLQRLVHMRVLMWFMLILLPLLLLQLLVMSLLYGHQPHPVPLNLLRGLLEQNEEML